MDKVRVIELFAGYGSQHLALKRLQRNFPEFEYEVVAFCEIEDSAIKAYQALHGDHIPNLGDITQVNPSDVPDCDLMTWSFPCTDISSAGLQQGLSEGSDTRSSLCWDAMRIFEVKRPKYLLMENVAALVSEKFVKDFNMLQLSLQKMGYTNFVRLINAKDMGVPQNRLRVFMVSILDCADAYYFPKPFKLERRLKDVLEQNVDERYYLSDERVAKLMQETAIHNDRGNGFAFRPHTPEEIASVLKCSGIGDKTDNLVAEPRIEIIADLQPDRQWQGVTRQQNKVVSIEGIAPACTAEHDRHPYKIAEPSIISPGHGYFKGAVNDEASPTVKCSAMQAQHFVSTGIRIRRLTKRELYRLMDVDEPDIDTLMATSISKTSHSKLAGNSIVVSVLYHIFRTMFIDTVPLEGTQTTLF